MTWLSRRADGLSTGTDPPVSLLEQLRAEFPEVCAADVAEALNQAHAVASTLEGNVDVGRGRLAALARDRLDVIRIRSASASRRVGRHVAPNAAGVPADRPAPRREGAPGPVRDDQAEDSMAAGADRYHRVRDLVMAQAGRAAVDADCLCRTAAARLGAAAVAVSVPGGLVVAQTIGAAGPFAREMEELQVVLGEGPSLDGLGAGSAVSVDDLSAPRQRARWPVFAAAASDAGFASVCVLPMRMGAARFGVLVVYLDREGGLDPDALDEARTFATIALELLLDCAELGAAAGDRDPTAATLFFDDRPEIHQATGMVSAQLAVDLGTALLRIRAHAFSEGRLLSAVAADVVARRLLLRDDRVDADERDGREAP